MSGCKRKTVLYFDPGISLTEAMSYVEKYEVLELQGQGNGGKEIKNDIKISLAPNMNRDSIETILSDKYRTRLQGLMDALNRSEEALQKVSKELEDHQHRIPDKKDSLMADGYGVSIEQLEKQSEGFLRQQAQRAEYIRNWMQEEVGSYEELGATGYIAGLKVNKITIRQER